MSEPKVAVPTERHLVRARDLADRAYAEPLEVADLARAAGLSPAHFSRRFREAFGVTPHGYLLTRRLERAAALLRNTDHSVARICVEVGLTSLGSFTSSFTRTYGRSPTAYRDAFPPSRTECRCRSVWSAPMAALRSAVFEKTRRRRRPRFAAC